jgi:hypothetical protein
MARLRRVVKRVNAALEGCRNKEREFMMTKKYRVPAVLGVVGVLLLACGCGKETRLQRVPMHGTITMKSGEQLNGSITYQPEPGHKGPTANATVKDGKYEFDRVNGPTAGPHTVTITRIVSRDASMRTGRGQQPLGDRAKWTFSAEAADDGQCVKDFTIDK